MGVNRVHKVLLGGRAIGVLALAGCASNTSTPRDPQVSPSTETSASSDAGQAGSSNVGGGAADYADVFVEPQYSSDELIEQLDFYDRHYEMSNKGTYQEALRLSSTDPAGAAEVLAENGIGPQDIALHTVSSRKLSDLTRREAVERPLGRA